MYSWKAYIWNQADLSLNLCFQNVALTFSLVCWKVLLAQSCPQEKVVSQICTNLNYARNIYVYNKGKWAYTKFLLYILDQQNSINNIIDNFFLVICFDLCKLLKSTGWEYENCKAKNKIIRNQGIERKVW